MTKTADNAKARAALARATAPDEVKTVYALLERERAELERELTAPAAFERFRAGVLAELRRNPLLLECEPEQVLAAALLAGRLGLELGPLGLVYLVPAAPAVEFVIGYRGFIALAYRSGHVKDVAAGLVGPEDRFEYRKGTRPYLDHWPDAVGASNPPVAAYAVARLRTGGAVFEVITEPDWQKARSASISGAKNEGPWRDEPGAMIRKTAVRRLEPFLPKSAELELAAVRDDAPAPPLAELLDTAGAL